MTANLHAQLVESNERSIAKASAEYRAMILRYKTPEPRDAETLGQVLKTLSLHADDVRRDIAAVEKVERLTRGLRTADQRAADERAMMEAGSALDEARLAYDRAQTAYNLAQGRVLAASRAEANDAAEIAGAKKSAERIYGVAE